MKKNIIEELKLEEEEGDDDDEEFKDDGAGDDDEDDEDYQYDKALYEHDENEDVDFE